MYRHIYLIGGWRWFLTIYFRIATIVTAAMGLLIYTLLFDRKYFFYLLIGEVICSGILSFSIFYYIGSYEGNSNEVNLNTDLKGIGSGFYRLNMNVIWEQKPEIFRLYGNNDMLIVRYNPLFTEVMSSTKKYITSEKGKPLVELDNEYEYSKIKKGEREIGFNIDDAVDTERDVVLQWIKPGGIIKIFYLHDYKIPLASNEYWEKQALVEFQ